MSESLFNGAVTVDAAGVHLHNPAALESAHMDALVWQAVFADEAGRDRARWILWELAQQVGTRPASIHDLYIARGRGECSGFTVPAINVRAMSYDTARAIFRTARKLNAGAFILEIARSEIAYTEQRPAEYVAVMLAAALREGFRGPVFIQGDHFQVNHKKFAVDPVTEVNAVKAIVKEAVAAGFYNIDVDTSTLVDLSKPTLAEQQRLNCEVCVDITRAVRAEEPAGVTISIGGEIGEVGTSNSTPEELEAFMEGFNAELAAQAPGMAGLSKISVQSGTSHGGIVLADGSIADVKLDLDTLATLSTIARERYQMSGAVQHGASTLVDLSKPTLAEQQRLNCEVCVEITRAVRAEEPAGVTISIGGEIGEVGTSNSTPEELEAFMEGFNAELAAQAPGMAGLSKISVQSGTSHGGIVLADGSIADVKLDLETLATLSTIARERYQMSGAVQHGASTLPDSAFHHFPRTETAEIHLATNFQNMMYDHIPAELREEIYRWLDVNAKDERKATDSDEQFYYKTRKKAIGPFKQQLWSLPADLRARLGSAYDAKFEFLFTQLGIGGTQEIVSRFVHAPAQHRAAPDGTTGVVAAPDDADLSD